jgi:hypothetical protein
MPALLGIGFLVSALFKLFSVIFEYFVIRHGKKILFFTMVLASILSMFSVFMIFINSLINSGPKN